MKDFIVGLECISRLHEGWDLSTGIVFLSESERAASIVADFSLAQNF